MKKFFFTGTGTDVGKTYVMCKWLAKRKAEGIKVHGLKPVVSGSIINKDKDKEIWLDEEFISNQNDNKSLPVTWYRFSPPIAPNIAAQKISRNITVESLISKINLLNCQNIDELYIEGAGGIMVPLNNTETWIDFIHLAGLEVILVVGMTLGCINQALLSEHVIFANNLKYRGWISNEVDPKMQVYTENLNTLKCFMQGTYLGNESYKN